MITDIVRKLAKSNEYQTLYNRSKDINGIRLFKNELSFSYIQILFLNWLSIYNSLYMDLIRGEEFLDEEVLNDNIRTDAYLIYRSKIKNKEKDKPDNNKKTRVQAPGIPKIIFTPKRK